MKNILNKSPFGGLRQFLATPLTDIESLKRDIQEREVDLKNLQAIETLVENKCRACKIVVCLPNDNVIEHWIEENGSLWNTIYTERGVINKDLKELKDKLAHLEATENANETGPVNENPGPVDDKEDILPAPEPSVDNHNIDDFPL
jgi:hypothetical protein